MLKKRQIVTVKSEKLGYLGERAATRSLTNWGGEGGRHSHIFDGIFFPLSDLCKYFDHHSRISEGTP